MRDPATRAGYCAGVFLLVWVGIVTMLAGHGFSAGIAFGLAGAVFWPGVSSARRGKI